MKTLMLSMCAALVACTTLAEEEIGRASCRERV